MRAAFSLAILIGTTWTVWAGSNGPYIVIPGRLGVPIIINGVDASYSVVEGDWGLGKGVHVQPTVYGGRFIDPEPNVGHYYPSSGHLPGYGRLEIEPPGKSRPAESFHQSWSAESMPQPAQPAVPLYPPPVITAPQNGEAGIPFDFANPPQEFRDRRPRKLRP
jgi:hypothetical protein